MSLYLENPESNDDRQYADFYLDRNGKSLLMPEYTKKQILEMHFGSEFYRLKEEGFDTHIYNAMEEYKEQELQKYITNGDPKTP
jgi:hypothetical protein